MTDSDTIVVFPAAPSPELVRTLDMSGFRWTSVGSAEEATKFGPAGGWAGAVVCVDDDNDAGWVFARAVRGGGSVPAPVMVLLTGAQLDDLGQHHDLFDDFCITPFHPRELEARLRHMFTRTGAVAPREDLIEHGGLVLNLETYQATFNGRPLDLTYMEYGLLKFLAQNPGKVFTRETLLSRVWGYDYYGGARTVDVHIRRLRAKLGEEHANLIQTVRSVGYSFGQSRWGG